MILITGGTGSIGRSLAEYYIDITIDPVIDVTIFSHNEGQIVEMKKEHPEYNYVLGDIRDPDEICEACRGAEYVFHFAAIKHIDICEKQPQEAVKTNIIGTMNVINACNRLHCKLVNMSSDKAINASSVYGRTKALAEAMATQSGYVSIRSGNVLWSSGSVLRIWQRQLERENKISLTSKEMTRFFIHPANLASFIYSNRDSKGIITTPMKSYRMFDIANEFIRRFGSANSWINITGLRPGERLHEFKDEVTSSEQNICTDLDYIFK